MSREIYREFGYPRIYVGKFFPDGSAEIIYKIRKHLNNSELSDGEIYALLGVYLIKKLMEFIPKVVKEFEIKEFEDFINKDKSTIVGIENALRRLKTKQEE